MVENSACTTLLLADKRCPVEGMPAELRLLKLIQRCDLHLAVDSHKHVYNLDCSLHKFFKTKETRVTRWRGALELPDLRTNTGRKAIFYQDPNAWMKIQQIIFAIVDQTVLNESTQNSLLHDVNHPE